MAERVINDGLVLLNVAATGDISAAVAALTGYTDFSAVALTFNIDESQTNVTILPHGENRRARVLSGQRSGTLTMTFLRNPSGVGSGNETIDVEAAFETIKAAGGRFQFVIQEDRASLITSPAIVPVPAASPANPQYAGSAIFTSINPFGTADGTTAAVVSVTADLDRDYARYTA